MSQEWKLVPMVPTKEMMLNGSACQHHEHDDLSCIQRDMRRGIWDKMIAAAPVPPAGGEVERYQAVALFTEEGNKINYESPGPWMVKASEHDAHVTRLQAEIAALQQRLNVADQRVDELESTLSECITEMSLALQDHAVRSAMTVVGRTRFLALVKGYNEALSKGGRHD